METILEFMSEKAIPEHVILIIELNNLFNDYGYIAHEESLNELKYGFGVLDDVINVDRILNTYKQHLIKLLSNLFIVVYEEITIYQLKDMVLTLLQLEKSIESQSILSLYQEDNIPIQQLLDWVQFIDESKLSLFEDYILEVSESLIENIVELHELRVPLEPLEVNPKIPIRIALLKKLIKQSNSDIPKPLLVLDHIKKYGFKEFVDKETLSAKFGTLLRAKPITNKNLKDITLEVLAICLLLDCQGDFSSRCREFIELNFPNPLIQSDIQSQLSKLIMEYDIKC